MFFFHWLNQALRFWTFFWTFLDKNTKSAHEKLSLNMQIFYIAKSTFLAAVGKAMMRSFAQKRMLQTITNNVYKIYREITQFDCIR